MFHICCCAPAITGYECLVDIKQPIILIWLATPKRSVRGRAVVRQGIRPDTLLLIGQFEHWATPVASDFGVPSLNSLATMSLALTDATGSGADLVRVKLCRAAEVAS